jgi:hypothetical protein
MKLMGRRQRGMEGLYKEFLEHVENLYAQRNNAENWSKSNTWLTEFQYAKEAYYVTSLVLVNSLSTPMPVTLLFCAIHTLVLSIRTQKPPQQGNKIFYNISKSANF